ncbi:MAG: putative CRISPR-associated protein [Magnetococcales bacterium]|nr:putative CRISPR-associated protein [Magnetococcales bacterium]
MRTIVCTTGTSLAGPNNRFTETEGNAPYRQRIQDRLQREQREHPTDFLVNISAETNSLAKLKVTAKDRIVLLRTETQDGQVCAEGIKTVIEQQFDATVSIEEIGGLQVSDATVFKKNGVQNLFAALDRHCILPGGDSAKPGVFLNMTGGFKAVAAYLVLYGMLYQVPVVYLYEKSNQLLTLPPAPLQFDWERMQPAADAFIHLYKELEVSKKEFFERIPGASYEDRQWYETLLEDVGQGKVNLSAFGLLVARRLEQDGEVDEAVLMLSPSALKVWNSHADRRHFTEMLEKVQNPLSRRSEKHAGHRATDLTICKPITPGAPRMAYWVDNGKVYVGELFAHHDDYERFYGPNGPKRKKKDYGISEFSSLTPLDGLG